MVLVGILMTSIVPKMSQGLWTLTISFIILTPIAISLKSYGEIKIISWFGLIATAIVVVVSVVMSFLFYGSSQYSTENTKHNFSHSFLNVSTFSNAFNVFTFAFGATAIFPNIFVKMEHKEEWPKAVIAGYGSAFLLYAPIGIVGYHVYGDYLGTVSTILDAIQSFDTSTAIVINVCSAIMIAHILSAFPIIINPIFRVVERKWLEDEQGNSPTPKRLMVRTIIMIILIVVALFFPYFLNIMSLVSCISVSLSGYILPCFFYWKICRPSQPEKVWLVIIVIFGLLGSVVGIILSVQDLINNVKKNPDPFSGLFTLQ